MRIFIRIFQKCLQKIPKIPSIWQFSWENPLNIPKNQNSGSLQGLTQMKLKGHNKIMTKMTSKWHPNDKLWHDYDTKWHNCDMIMMEKNDTKMTQLWHNYDMIMIEKMTQKWHNYPKMSLKTRKIRKNPEKSQKIPKWIRGIFF